jgi:hypothetical protein
MPPKKGTKKGSKSGAQAKKDPVVESEIKEATKDKPQGQ